MEAKYLQGNSEIGLALEILDCERRNDTFSVRDEYFER
jgi:hypothetical protein